MASGFGAMGGQGRCYELWKDMVECRTSYLKSAPEQRHCGDLLEDYSECLHHTKELARLRTISEAAAHYDAAPPTILEGLARQATE
mmetsp:Transcript_15177/g.59394  ORF Transcript_15177/g.59394 Transcript_15177/m.59394 type:complete len:86 (+) Transcript_15177:24-281(+)